MATKLQRAWATDTRKSHGLLDSQRKSICVGDDVRIKAGTCGSGFVFKVTDILSGGATAGLQVYGDKYGPLRIEEVERVR